MAVKLLIDLGLTIAMLLAFAYRLTGNTAHELIGLTMFILLIVHNALNWRWYKNIGRGGGLKRKLGAAVTLTLLVVAMALLISSVAASQTLFDFIRFSDGLLERQIHTLAAYWILVLMSVHIGFHWGLIKGVIGQALKLPQPGRLRPWLARLSGLSVMAGGVWASFDRELGSKLLMRHSFDYWEGGSSGFFITYLLIMGLYAGLTHFFLKVLDSLTPKQAWTAWPKPAAWRNHV